MIKVKMLRSVGSANGVHQPGHIVELDDKTASAWIKAGLAEEADKAEAKVKPAHENKLVTPNENKEAAEKEEKPVRRRTTKNKMDEDAE